MNNLSKLSQRISKSFEQARQLTSEYIGTADEVTSFPPDYRVLEEKVDKLKTIYEDLVRVHRQFIKADRYEPPIQDQMVDVFGKINQQFDKLGQSSSRSPKPHSSPSADDMPPFTIQHAAAKASLEGVNVLQPEGDELSQTLKKYGQAMDKLGGYRMAMDQKIEHAFLRPMQNIVDAIIGNAMHARKSAQRSRLELDSCKSKCKTSKSDRLDVLQKELADAEAQFHAHVDEATQRMQNVVDNPLVVQCISELINAQLSYHQNCSQALTSITL
jgi:hypothetical protein